MATEEEGVIDASRCYKITFCQVLCLSIEAEGSVVSCMIKSYVKLYFTDWKQQLRKGT